MVTRNRVRLAERAVKCFTNQSWKNKELVILDDGAEDYEPMLAPYRERLTIRYEKLPEVEGRFLGELRNLAIDAAEGDYCAQWDDDDWYHPERIERQMAPLLQGSKACTCEWTLMHLDQGNFLERPFRAKLSGGTSGTIIHKKIEGLRYRNEEKGEDDFFRDLFRDRGRYTAFGREASQLFIRCHHGDNTWDKAHFLRRLRNTPLHLAQYLFARYARGELLTHPAFQLNEAERQACELFLTDSRRLGLFSERGETA